MEQKQNRSSFSGKLGFVLSAAGASVGLGNIWRFPYLAAKYGGGIFLLIYIVLALTLQTAGGHTMQFKEFDTSRIDEYTRRAKESWGDTPAYREFEQNAAERTVQESSDINNQLMALTAGFGALQNLPIDNPAVQAQAAKLQAFITEHYYTCTKAIFAQLGQMYGAGGEFTANINAAGGPGTAEFAAKAIAVYCET